LLEIGADLKSVKSNIFITDIIAIGSRYKHLDINFQWLKRLITSCQIELSHYGGGIPRFLNMWSVWAL
jgi:hypothetical protein